MRRHLEDQEQIALMRWAGMVRVGESTLAELLAHVPNGGWRNPIEAARFKAMGVKAGLPDILLPMRTETYGAGWWELKVGRNKPTEEQLRWHVLLRSMGHYVQT
ncbi:MAG TPA: VRR-NUC domain-containing protein, partial [Steroidobacteraceae bacterium]|nr:VRR-NUC domain-containing protein [Steroidobacteraceae bacterium]